MKNKKNNPIKKNAKQIEIRGLVQGVGFRPYIYRLACDNNLSGWVKNKTDCIIIHIEGSLENIVSFEKKIGINPPSASRIESIDIKEIQAKDCRTFEIIQSTSSTSQITEVSPDIAVCDDCLGDIKNHNNRINYPFTNCTNCGPRFSIISEIPYDRINTSMNEFKMCDSCMEEYKSPENRRFHAQPNACLECGPEYSLHIGEAKITGIEKILEIISSLLIDGKVIALKGVGGFHLICNAYNNLSIDKLREIKHRDKKPFALMFSSIETLEKEALVNETEEALLTSPQRPIVLLKKINHDSLLPNLLSEGINTIGAMLPYTPIHYLIFEKTKIDAMVYTSGNLSDEPIIIDNDKALEVFTPLCSAVLTYNRTIVNRNDDSVAAVYSNQKRILRRSRGYAPSPIPASINVDNIMAAGAELKNTFCIGKGNHAILSQHIGDLKNIETLEFYNESIGRSKKLFKADPEIVTHDLHPDYLSTKFAEESGLSLTAVQHHHAHIASCMAEHNLDQKVIGISFDGTGYGDDGKIWGGEIFLNDLCDYKRIFHLDYVSMPGGEKAIKETWRMGISYLYKVFGENLIDLDIPFVKNL
ncbi:MAG: carbamoyltransferase HypF, partial [Spirochaetes bacterium]|nr:carbamoyltransferase HypF [Spirochaetota bacterium]